MIGSSGNEEAFALFLPHLATTAGVDGADKHAMTIAVPGHASLMCKDSCMLCSFTRCQCMLQGPSGASTSLMQQQRHSRSRGRAMRLLAAPVLATEATSTRRDSAPAVCGK